MLRDLLVRLDGAGTWPCDEINYIWRHGNVRYPSDEFRVELATSSVKRYVNRQFDKLARDKRIDTVIEKTCANSLRIPFVNEIVGNAKYVFIVRDGLDAIASAYRRWHAKMDLLYLAEKARFVPLTDMPYYAFRFGVNRLHRIFSRERKLKSWGPIIDDMQELQRTNSTIEICALQWQACVETADTALQDIQNDRVYRIRYEDFVDNPTAKFADIADFVGKDVPETMNQHLRQNVQVTSKGKGRSRLTDDETRKLNLLIGRTLEKYGYN